MNLSQFATENQVSVASTLVDFNRTKGSETIGAYFFVMGCDRYDGRVDGKVSFALPEVCAIFSLSHEAFIKRLRRGVGTFFHNVSVYTENGVKYVSILYRNLSEVLHSLGISSPGNVISVPLKGCLCISYLRSIITYGAAQAIQRVSFARAVQQRLDDKKKEDTVKKLLSPAEIIDRVKTNYVDPDSRYQTVTKGKKRNVFLIDHYKVGASYHGIGTAIGRCVDTVQKRLSQFSGSIYRTYIELDREKEYTPEQAKVHFAAFQYAIKKCVPSDDPRTSMINWRRIAKTLKDSGEFDKNYIFSGNDDVRVFTPSVNLYEEIFTIESSSFNKEEAIRFEPYKRSEATGSKVKRRGTKSSNNGAVSQNKENSNAYKVFYNTEEICPSLDIESIPF